MDSFWGVIKAGNMYWLLKVTSHHYKIKQKQEKIKRKKRVPRRFVKSPNITEVVFKNVFLLIIYIYIYIYIYLSIIYIYIYIYIYIHKKQYIYLLNGSYISVSSKPSKTQYHNEKCKKYKSEN